MAYALDVHIKYKYYQHCTTLSNEKGNLNEKVSVDETEKGY